MRRCGIGGLRVISARSYEPEARGGAGQGDRASARAELPPLPRDHKADGAWEGATDEDRADFAFVRGFEDLRSAGKAATGGKIVPASYSRHRHYGNSHAL